MLGRVIEWMYPTVCPVCQKVLGKGKIICDICKDELYIINEPRCAKCGKPLTDSGKTYCNDCKKMKHYYDRARSVFEYTGEMKMFYTDLNMEIPGIMGNFLQKWQKMYWKIN